MTLYAITPLSVPSLLYLCHVGKLTSFQELIKTFTLKFFRDAKGSFNNASLSGGNLFFADNHVGDGLCLIGRFDRLVGVPLITLFYKKFPKWWEDWFATGLQVYGSTFAPDKGYKG